MSEKPEEQSGRASQTPESSAAAAEASGPRSGAVTSEAPESSAATASSAAPSTAEGPGISEAANATSEAPNESTASASAAESEAASGKSRSKTNLSNAAQSKHSKTGSKAESSKAPTEDSTKRSPSASSRGPSRKRVKLGELDLKTAKIGFLGAGKMTESTINGLIHYGKVSPSNIHVAAPTAKNLERFKALGCRVTRRNYDIFGRYDCDVIFLCFHGYVIKQCYKLGGNRPHPITTNYIPHQRHPIYILSLVSGVSLTDIKRCLLNPDSADKYIYEIHRIMMNTAVGHGLGICAVDCEPDSKRLSAPLRQLLSSIAHLEYVPAAQMDAACAIGGSGLAFSYYFINALADGAFKMGLSRAMAIKFASKTAQCAAQTLLESGKHPAELRDTVSSPSGAAIYGIHVLDKADVASGVTAAVEAAHKRANDLATQDTSS